jgi:Restriction endonuclease BglII
LGINLLPEDIRATYQIEERHHACSILISDFPEEWNDLITVLRNFVLRRSSVQAKGGRKSPIAQAVDDMFAERHWIEHRFQISVTADGVETLAPTHKVDYFKNRVAIEMEWNNKDPFFDRDLTSFRLLFELNVVSVGVIITRADELQRVFDELGKGASAGNSTTHMSKLIPKMHNRASGGCPVLAFGITMQKYDPNS